LIAGTEAITKVNNWQGKIALNLGNPTIERIHEKKCTVSHSKEGTKM
jgi:hypothetical protein